jgi:hypothetical protein
VPFSHSNKHPQGMASRNADAYDRVEYKGYTFNRRTVAALETAQAKLKDDPDWTVYQGSYNTGVSASAGTHDGGGAVDLSPYNWEKRVRALRAVGFAAWHRPALPGVWGEHIHAILVGDREMSSGANAQVVDYLNFRNGLADHAVDNTWHPNPPVKFDYPAWKVEQRRIAERAARASAAVKNAIASLIRARKNTDDPQGKAEIQATIQSLRNH